MSHYKGSELKPCPFCGGDADVMMPEEFDDHRGTVMCMSCFATSPDADNNWQDAVAAWNTRTIDHWSDDMNAAPRDGSWLEMCHAETGYRHIVQNRDVSKDAKWQWRNEKETWFTTDHFTHWRIETPLPKKEPT